MKRLLLASSAFVASASAALANATNVGGLAPSTAVPEISALEGTAALAAVAAILLFAWERRRSAS